jgi:hypothetical protein
MASSMRVSVLSRSLPTRQTSTGTTATTTSFRDRDNGLSSSASSLRSVVRTSSDSYASAMSGNTIGGVRSSNGGMSPARMIVKETRAMKDRPDSKLTPSVLTSPSILEPEVLEEDQEEEVEEEEYDEYDDESRNGDEQPSTPQPTIKKVLITRASLASVTSRSTLSSLAGSRSTSSVSTRPLSSASSVRSQNTVRRSVGSSAGSSRLNVTPSTTKSTISRPTRTQRISTTATSRPTSSLSSTTDSTATYRTASPGGLSTPTRSRRTSGASTVSIRTPSGGKQSSPISDRSRRISGASVSSVASNTGSPKSPAARVRTTSTGKKTVVRGVTPPLPDPKKLSPNVPRPGSIHSSISGGSTASNSTSKKVVRNVVSKKKSGDVEQSSLTLEIPVKEPEVEEAKEGREKDVDKEKEMDVDVEVEVDKDIVKGVDENPPIAENIIVEDPPLPSTTPIKPKDRPSIPVLESTEHKKSSSSTSTGSVATLKRKGSSDTITTIISSPPAPIIVDAPLIKQLPPTPSSDILPPPPPPLQHQSSTLRLPTSVVVDYKVVPQGATLDIGIPCIIASKRKRFKAYARYIGEVQGEIGAWVGVEVPIPFGDSYTSSSGGDASSVGDKVHGDDRQWNDGTWGGIRYFEIGGMGGSEWDYGSGGTNDDRASRRRRVDGGSVIWGNSGGGKGDKGILKREGDQLSIASASEMRRKKFRSVSPAVSDMSGVETRGLFVRPQQVLYVVDAVGIDL